MTALRAMYGIFRRWGFIISATMRIQFHRRMLPIVIALAAAQIGLATYIAAAPRPGAPQFTIATASDDPHPSQPPPQSAPPQPVPIPPSQPTPVTSTTSCPSIRVTPSANMPTGVQTSGVGREIGRFVLIYPRQSDCVVSRDVGVREVALSFTWTGRRGSGLTAPALRDVTIMNADRSVTYANAGRVAFTAPARSVRLAMRQPMVLSYGQSREFIVVADTTTLATAGTQLSTTVAQLVTELPYAAMVGAASY